MSEILTFGLMVGQPALRNLCLAGSPRTLLAMSAPRSQRTFSFVNTSAPCQKRTLIPLVVLLTFEQLIISSHVSFYLLSSQYARL